MEIPDRLELDVSGMGIGDTCVSPTSGPGGRDLPRRPGRDRARNVTVPAVIVEPEPEEEELEEGEEGAGEEGEEAPEGEGEGAEPSCRGRSRRRRRPAGRRELDASVPSGRARLDARPARRGSREPRRGVRADPAQHRLPGCGRARAPARRCVSIEVQRPAGRGAARGAPCRDPEARDVHERLGQVGRGRAAILQGRPGGPAGRPRRRRPRARSSAGSARRWAGGPQRAPLDRLRRSGRQEFLRLRVGVGRPGKGDRRPVADYVLSEFEPELDVDALVGRAADAVEVLARDGLEETQARYN